MATQNIADVTFQITWKKDDIVSKLNFLPTSEVTKEMKSAASKNGKTTIAPIEVLRDQFDRIKQENIVLFLNGFAKGESDSMDHDAVKERLQDVLQDFINMEEGASTAMDTNVTPMTGTNQPSDKKAAAEALAAEKKAQLEAAKAKQLEEREAAAAKRKEEAEVKQAALKAEREAAAAEREAEAAAKKAEREAKAAEAEVKMAEAKAEHDEIVAAAEAELADAVQALKTAKEARTAALKAVAEEYKVSVPGGTGAVTSVPKSSSFILEDDYLGLDGVVIAKGEKLTVKKIHLAGIAAELTNQEIVDEIKKHFPHGSTTVKDVAWHRNMVKNGKMDAETGKRIA